MAGDGTSFDSFLVSAGCTRYDPVTYVYNKQDKVDVLKAEADKREIRYVPYERGEAWLNRGKESGWVFFRPDGRGGEFTWFVAVVPEDNH